MPALPLDDRLRNAIAAALDDAAGRIAATVSAHLEDLRDLDNSDTHDHEAALEEAVNAARLSAQETLRASLEQARTEASQRVEQAYEDGAASALTQERASQRGRIEGMLTAVRGLDQATALGDALDHLAQGLAAQAPRSAVFVVRHQLTGWRLQGFGEHDAAPRRLMLPLAEAGVLAAAVERGRAVSTREMQGEGPGFAAVDAGQVGLAVPVMVGGTAIAVTYAEGPASETDGVALGSWPEVMEVLARHAARCLESLTAKRAPAAPRRATAAQPVASQV